MYKFSEYGFSLTDNNNRLTEKEHCDLASNIRNLCFAISEQSKDFPLEHPFALCLRYKNGLYPTVYSDFKMTYFGVYNIKTGKISMIADVEEFNPSESWFSKFMGRCIKRFWERDRLDNPQATVYPPEILDAWNERLLTVEKDLPSNVSYHDNPHVHPNPEATFIDNSTEDPDGTENR